MPLPKNHVEILDKQMTELSDALAHLGKGKTILDIIKIIHNPGYTTPAEFLFTQTLIDAMQTHINAINRIQTQFHEAARQVGARG